MNYKRSEVIMKKEDIIQKYRTEAKMGIDDLRAIISMLRAPDGCPWDKVQTHESIRNNFIEETYEAVEAIDNGDVPLLREELGDVLLQVVFHACMEEEKGSFSLDDVANEVCRKLVLRHPHVFADVQADTVGAVLNNWDAIKQKSKHQSTATETLESVARSLPALMRAEKMYGRAAKAGYAGAAMPSDDDSSVGADLLRIVCRAKDNGIDAEQKLYEACDAMTERVRAAENGSAVK